ncbi:hypothetical protein [Candidatus Nitrosopumilus sediminis]|uniref:hypothetical protein n=1 Tax=Candidatus Nitrosopumilus sediminis TaxID=1229909 RepID=UPI0012FEB703|nr:hypothetical protein [Candidatus Nitrosopumilus sediminis]
MSILDNAYSQMNDDTLYSIYAKSKLSDSEDYDIHLKFMIVDNSVSVISDTINFNNNNYHISSWDTRYNAEKNIIVLKGTGTQGKYVDARVLFVVSYEYYYPSPKFSITGVFSYHDGLVLIKTDAKTLLSKKIKTNIVSDLDKNEEPIEIKHNDNLKIVADHSLRVTRGYFYDLTMRVYNANEYDKIFNILSPYLQNWGYVKDAKLTIEILHQNKTIEKFNKTTNQFGYSNLQYYVPTDFLPGEYTTKISSNYGDKINKIFFVLRGDETSEDTLNSNLGNPDPPGKKFEYFDSFDICRHEVDSIS